MYYLCARITVLLWSVAFHRSFDSVIILWRSASHNAPGNLNGLLDCGEIFPSCLNSIEIPIHLRDLRGVCNKP